MTANTNDDEVEVTWITLRFPISHWRIFVLHFTILYMMIDRVLLVVVQMTVLHVFWHLPLVNGCAHSLFSMPQKTFEIKMPHCPKEQNHKPDYPCNSYMIG